jgi:hypothetical protein
MPRVEALPQCLGGLPARQGLAVRADPDFHRDLDRLITELRKHGSVPNSPAAPRDEQQRVPLELSDVQVIPDKATKTCLLDFRVANRGRSDVMVNKVKLEVVEILGIGTLGFMEFSKVYDLDISSLKRPNDTATCNVAQVLRSGEVDRFGVRLIARELGTGQFRLWELRPTLITDLGEVEGPIVEVGLPYPNSTIQKEKALRPTGEQIQERREREERRRKREAAITAKAKFTAPPVDPDKPRFEQFFQFICPFCGHDERTGLWIPYKTCSQCKIGCRIVRESDSSK